MNFLLHGATLTFASFLAINLLVSALVIAVVARQPRIGSPTFWFALRMLPAAVAASFAAVVFVPSYWRYEPRETAEGFDITLIACALAALLMLAAAGARGVASWWRANRRARLWMHTSLPIDLATTLPAFAVDADQAVMALAGVFRPRLFVTRGLIDALTEEELAASVAHELRHSRAWDNLKRLAMCAVPDLLTTTGVARTIERRWASAAEHAADRMCGRADAAMRCALASALVKVARLTPPEPIVAEPISTLIGGGEIAARVRVLLDDRAAAPERRRRSLEWLGAAIVAAVLASTYGPLLRSVHELTEILVHSLP
ncbi:MAG TPA: M48 family metalloprotease [Vicinamibacterales bacterium]|nr:M48 family metalloprotease [Vicinamibacterales bacterium]